MAKIMETQDPSPDPEGPDGSQGEKTTTLEFDSGEVLIVTLRGKTGEVTSDLASLRGKTGEVTSDLASHGDESYNSAIDGVEALILGLACAGVDISTTQFKAGCQSALEAIANNA